MSYELLAGLTIFALVSSITPGPNTLMLMASGANFGIRRSVPHMLGVGLGFALMLVLVGGGVVRLFEAYPVSYLVLKVFSVAYLLYLAGKIALAAPKPAESGARDRPLTFVQAALFQWLNPKAWTMALTAVSVYSPTRSLGAIALVAAIFGAIALPSVSLWAVLGEQMGRMLRNPQYLRAFNVGMALVLVASLYPAVAP